MNHGNNFAKHILLLRFVIVLPCVNSLALLTAAVARNANVSPRNKIGSLAKAFALQNYSSTNIALRTIEAYRVVARQ